MKNFYARKLGMTSYVAEGDVVIPVTVLQLLEGVVVSVDEKNSNHRVAFVDSSITLKKPDLTFFSRYNLGRSGFLKTVKFSDLEYKEGLSLPLDQLGNALKVDASALSIGKGFQGVMKRHNFGGLRASHGVSVSHRSHGSTGGRQDPGKVFKNKKMAGHMGNAMVTIKNISVVKYDADKKVLYVRGGVPGSKSGLVKITYK
jgi:large subunit ribosomal protein L3